MIRRGRARERRSQPGPAGALACCVFAMACFGCGAPLDAGSNAEVEARETDSRRVWLAVHFEYPGADAASVEAAFLLPAEERLAQVAGVKHLVAQAQAGAGTLWLEVEESELDATSRSLRDELVPLSHDLPVEVAPPQLLRLTSQHGERYLHVALSSPNHDALELGRMLDALIRSAQALPLVSLRRRCGPSPRIEVALDPARLLAYGLDANHVASRLADATAGPPDAAAGSQVLVRSRSRSVQNLDELGALVVLGDEAALGGGQSLLYLRDIATVQLVATTLGCQALTAAGPAVSASFAVTDQDAAQQLESLMDASGLKLPVDVSIQRWSTLQGQAGVLAPDDVSDQELSRRIAARLETAEPWLIELDSTTPEIDAISGGCITARRALVRWTSTGAQTQRDPSQAPTVRDPIHADAADGTTWLAARGPEAGGDSDHSAVQADPPHRRELRRLWLAAEDWDEAADAADAVYEMLAGLPGIVGIERLPPTQVRPSASGSLEIRPDRQRLADYQLSVAQLTGLVALATGGRTVGSLMSPGDQEIPVVLRIDGIDPTSSEPSSLGALRLMTSERVAVPISELATIQIGEPPPRAICRFDRQRAHALEITVEASALGSMAWRFVSWSAAAGCSAAGSVSGSTASTDAANAPRCTAAWSAPLSNL